MTNYERIKSMSVEELAEILVEYDGDYGTYRTYNCKDFKKFSDAAEDEIN